MADNRGRVSAEHRHRRKKRERDGAGNADSEWPRAGTLCPANSESPSHTPRRLVTLRWEHHRRDDWLRRGDSGDELWKDSPGATTQTRSQLTTGHYWTLNLNII